MIKIIYSFPLHWDTSKNISDAYAELTDILKKRIDPMGGVFSFSSAQEEKDNEVVIKKNNIDYDIYDARIDDFALPMFSNNEAYFILSAFFKKMKESTKAKLIENNKSLYDYSNKDLNFLIINLYSGNATIFVHESTIPSSGFIFNNNGDDCVISNTNRMKYFYSINCPDTDSLAVLEKPKVKYLGQTNSSSFTIKNHTENNIILGMTQELLIGSDWFV